MHRRELVDKIGSSCSDYRIEGRQLNAVNRCGETITVQSLSVLLKESLILLMFVRLYIVVVHSI